MRHSTLLLSFLLCTCVSAQTVTDSTEYTPTTKPADTAVRSLLSRMAWKEIDGSPNPGYLLLLTSEGNFNEDAGAAGARKYRNLLGRWHLDSTQSILTLSVDGLMGRGLVHSRYLRGRDYFIEYDVIDINNHELVLKDRATGKRRIMIGVEPDRVEDQAKKRLPQGPAPTTTTWTLPDFNGGG